MARLSGNPVSDYFQWPSGISLQIQCAGFPRSLHHEIGAFKCLTPSAKTADARVVFCKKKEDLPAAGETLRGRYKGLPWQIVCPQTDKGAPGYFFYAPFFSVFLFVRTCLIPILKKITIERGGFFLIGSAFSFRETVFILFGKPGSGKTRLLLDMLDAGGKILGDSELMLTADQKVFPAFPYVEARLKTLYGSSCWTSLRLRDKAYLWFCHILSLLSLRRISFNLLLNSADNPWMIPAASPGSFSRCLVLQLRQDLTGVGSLSPEDFWGAVEAYETSYQRSFGKGIYTPQLRELGLSQLKRLLAGASFGRSASGQTAHDFLQQEIKK
ncbi:MAG: hypothetical protein KBC91_07005 [Candidatus Omnitrophica bacterium]|nr:hypothetical protein [Candidatus Omnitrophota bacterium]